MTEERELRKRLEDASAPDEQGSAERAWLVVKAAHAEQRAVQPRRRWLGPLALRSAFAAALILALTPDNIHLHLI